MKVDKDLLKKVAGNARIQLTEEEIEEFLPQLKENLEHFRIIDNVNVDKVNPSFQPIPLKNISREDKVEPCLSQEKALSNAKHKRNGFFLGPKVV